MYGVPWCTYSLSTTAYPITITITIGVNVPSAQFNPRQRWRIKSPSCCGKVAGKGCLTFGVLDDRAGYDGVIDSTHDVQDVGELARPEGGEESDEGEECERPENESDGGQGGVMLAERSLLFSHCLLVR